MTLVTIHAVVDIPADVGVIEIGSIVPTVTTRALEHRVVTRVGVAGRAHAVRVAVIHVEPGVIERRTRPSRGRVASVAGRREPGGGVRRIRGGVVVRLVTAVTGGRQGGVVAVYVALDARDIRRMITRQREGRRVVIENRTQPVVEVVARIARGREAHHRVRRRVSSVVVRLMAGDAWRRSGQFVCPARAECRVVALRAGQRRVETGQVETSGGMIKSRAQPVGRGVALVAGGREPRLHVIRIGGPVEIGLMARHTRGRRGEVIWATLERRGVALRAL